MTFETDAFDIEITMSYVTFEAKILAAYMTFETNVLSLQSIDNPQKIQK